MNETNSEKKVTFWGVTTLVATAVVSVVTIVLSSDLITQGSVAAVALGVLLSVAKALASYTESRPAKHVAMAERAKADAQLVAASSLNTSKKQ